MVNQISSRLDASLTGTQTQSDLAGEQILVFDFGGQTAQLIARRVRELHVYCQLIRHDLSAERVKELNPKGIILSGGPASVYEAGAPQIDPGIFELGIPVLGICYGMQLLCRAVGGEISPAESREYGRTQIKCVVQNPLFKNLPEDMIAWMSHGDQVKGNMRGWKTIAASDTCPHAAMTIPERNLFGLQFHPEVTHTEHGTTLIENFVKGICGCRGTWQLSAFIDQQVELIRERVGNNRVICGLSGGVDSSVVAALIYKAIGSQLSCIFVDNGLLRQGEREQVHQNFGEHFKTDLHVVDASARFLSELSGVTDPQRKRKIIGKAFIDVFKEEAKSIQDATFLAQGTLYPDVIESGAAIDGPASTIKYHHNVGGLPAELGFELIEPLRDLFKDEVRKLGAELGLPEILIWRHPFPGPGLAVRCLGEITPARLEKLRKADAIRIEELHRSNLYHQVQQAFVVLLPVQTVGVMGDGRTYDDVLAIRSVNTEDFMTADWSRLPYDFLERVSTKITNKVKGINRVVYDISSKPPSTIEWE